MHKTIVYPWQWHDSQNYVQPLDYSNYGHFDMSGQAFTDVTGISGNADMGTLLEYAIQNLEKLNNQAGYEPISMLRLNIHTANIEWLWQCYPAFKSGL